MVELLQRTKITELPPNKDDVIIILPKKLPLEEGFKILVSNCILSAPVFDESTSQYCGVLDMVDLVTHLLSIFEEAEVVGMDTSAVLNKRERFKGVQVGVRAGAVPTMSDDHSLYDAVMAMIVSNAHRVIALDSQKQVTNIVTQSNVIMLLSNYLQFFQDKAAASVQSLGVGSTGVVYVNENQKALDAFRLMREKNVMGVAVVNNNFQLVGNISVRDLQAIRSDAHYLPLLYHTVKEYITILATRYSMPPRTVKCYPQTRLSEVVYAVVASGVHRCFVVEPSSDTVLSVISLIDILKALMS